MTFLQRGFHSHLLERLASDRHLYEYANQEAAHRCHAGEW